MQEQSIFTEALEKEDPAERAAFLDRACASDLALRGRIDRLLQRHQQTGNFLESQSPALMATVDEPVRERPGTVIGSYKLMEQIGEGGMGLVFVAEQQHPVRRKVALKVIKPGMDTRHVIARFEAERQALALMDHPNIARVLDAGETASGRPYFVMDYIRGVPITEFCDENQLTSRERLELFLQVCQAVQHAHQKGVIHRDIKPSNVLVMSHDGTPAVKVIDFGVAKAVGQQLTDKTVYTQAAQLIGTPLYMSPEQAGQSSLDVDTRTDIYALGVLLYELLTGTTPFDKDRLRSAGYDEIRRIIREEEPQKPSTRMSTLAQAGTTVSAQRKSDPKRLSQLFRGELDWIVMKALEKDRNRRYETANGFAADVQRYLNDETVQACPPSVGYRLKRFVRRNKGPVVAAVLVLVVLLVGIVGTTWGILRAESARQAEAERAEAETRERRRAEDNWEKAMLAVDEMLTAVAEKDLTTDGFGLPTLRERLLQKALKFYQQFLEEKSSDPRARIETGWAYLRVGRVYREKVLFGIGGIERVKENLQSANEAFEKATLLFDGLAAEFPTNPRYRHEAAEAHAARADVMRDLDLPQEAMQHQRSARSLYEGLVQDFPERPEYQEEFAAFLANPSGDARFSNQNNPEVVLANLRRSVAVCERLVAEHPDAPHYQVELSSNYHNLGDQLLREKHLREAEAVHRQGLAAARKAVEMDPRLPDLRSSLAFSYVRIAALFDSLDRRPEAEQALWQCVEVQEKQNADFPDVDQNRRNGAVWLLALARRLREEGRVSEAEGLYRKAIGCLETRRPLSLNYNNEALVDSYRELGQFLLLNGRVGEAEKLYRQALVCRERLAQLSPRDETWAEQAFSYRELGNCLLGAGKYKDAEQCYRDALPLLTRCTANQPNQGTWRIDLTMTYYLLGIVLNEEVRNEEAKQFSRQADVLAHALAEEKVNLRFSRLWMRPYQLMIIDELCVVGVMLFNEDKKQLAEKALRQAVTIAEKTDAAFEAFPSGERTAALFGTYGLLLAQTGRTTEAEMRYQQAIKISEKVVVFYKNGLRQRTALAGVLNKLAWLLSKSPACQEAKAVEAVALAERAVGLLPQERNFSNTLGVARYRAGKWKTAIVALEKSQNFQSGGSGDGDAYDGFFMSMAHWQLGEKEKAHHSYEKAVEWMDKNKPKDPELLGFRAEAASLLGIQDRPKTKGKEESSGKHPE